MTMLLQATLNGPRTRADHPGVPVSAGELARDAAACVREGARALHVHPRDAAGRESLAADVVDGAVSAIKARVDVPVGVTTGAWIEPDLPRRLSHVAGWRAPDFTSVNVSEDGAFEVMEACLRAGVGVEAGVWTVEDAERLVAGGLAGRILRVLIEPVDVPDDDAGGVVAAIHEGRDRHGVAAARLQHGDGAAVWTLLADAVRRGVDTRIGFEDTLTLPDGAVAPSNASLVRAARALGAGG